jgi:hypothetical protein
MLVDEHKEQLQSYYKLTKEDIEEITKDWSTYLLFPADPMEMSDPDNLEIAHDTPRPNKMKKIEEVQDLRNDLGKTSSVSPDRWGEEEEINGIGAEQKKGKVTSSRYETDPLKKRKVSSLKPSS